MLSPKSWEKSPIKWWLDKELLCIHLFQLPNHNLGILNVVGMVADKDLNQFVPQLFRDIVWDFGLKLGRRGIVLHMSNMFRQSHARQNLCLQSILVPLWFAPKRTTQLTCYNRLGPLPVGWKITWSIRPCAAYWTLLPSRWTGQAWSAWPCMLTKVFNPIFLNGLINDLGFFGSHSGFTLGNLSLCSCHIATEASQGVVLVIEVHKFGSPTPILVENGACQTPQLHMLVVDGVPEQTIDKILTRTRRSKLAFCSLSTPLIPLWIGFHLWFPITVPGFHLRFPISVTTPNSSQHICLPFLFCPFLVLEPQRVLPGFPIPSISRAIAVTGSRWGRCGNIFYLSLWM